MALNLSRNSRVFLTTNVDSAGKVQETASNGFTAANTYEIQVLDGFTFSQNTNTEAVTLNEAGATPVRGQRTKTNSRTRKGKRKTVAGKKKAAKKKKK